MQPSLIEDSPIAPPVRVEPPGSDRANADKKELRAYTRLKLALAAQLRLLREAFKDRGDERAIRRCDALMTKLAEDRFTLAVLGQFKRGKSSLMNAVIGRELLPVGVLPLTSAITILRFGPKERLLVQHRHWTFQHEVPVERLAEFVTERGNPGNRQQVQAAYLELPVPFLRRGLEFVDTPGVGSAIEANTTTTYQFLPACDAALFVTSADAPLTRSELEFLHAIRKHTRKLFFIINKVDLLSPAEREQAEQFTAQTIRRELDAKDIRLFAVSARAGVAAKLRDDPSGYEASGMAELQSALADFITHEKASTFLDSVFEKAIRLTDYDAAESELRRRVREVQAPSARERQTRLEARLRAIDDERERSLSTLRREFVEQVTTEFTREIDALTTDHREALFRQVDRLLSPAGWQPGLWRIRRIVSLLERRLRRAMSTWASGKIEQLAIGSAPQSRASYANLARSVSAIGDAVAEAAEIHASFYMGWDVLPDWKPANVGVPISVPRCEPPRIGGALKWLPISANRSRIREVLQKQLTRWLWSCRGAIITSAAELIGNAFDAWAREVATECAELSARALAPLSNGVRPETARTDAIIARVRTNLVRLRNEISAEPMEAGFDVAADELRKSPGSTIEQEERPSVDPLDLGRDLQTRGCPVCDHLTKVAFSFFARWQRALYRDESTQHTYAAELGLCPVHLWQLEAVSSPTGTSVGHAELVSHVAYLLRKAAGEPRTNRRIPVPPRRCRVCQLLREEETRYVDQLSSTVDHRAGRNAYERSQGLCLNHLSMLVANVDDQAARFLLCHAAKRFEELAEDMQSYGMKTEALRRELRHSDEEDAYFRALTHLAGSRMVCLPWKSEPSL